MYIFDCSDEFFRMIGSLLIEDIGPLLCSCQVQLDITRDSETHNVVLLSSFIQLSSEFLRVDHLESRPEAISLDASPEVPHDRSWKSLVFLVMNVFKYEGSMTDCRITVGKEYE
jgi:hypothetical protein